MKAEASVPLNKKAYERKLRDLHAELVKLQEWAKQAGGKVCIVFEGRDGAGKGGVIKAITDITGAPRCPVQIVCGSSVGARNAASTAPPFLHLRPLRAAKSPS